MNHELPANNMLSHYRIVSKIGGGAMITLMVFTFLCLAQTDQNKQAPPNIVFILIDDLRWDELGIAGHPFIKTPNIDRIGREGAQFRNAFMTTPLCSPSRASFLTGQYAHTHGITDNVDRSAASHRLVTFPLLLHQSGYETAFIGKWHMGNDDKPRPGFDRWVSFKGQGTYLNPDINEDGKAVKPSGYTTDILNGYAVEFIKRRHAKPCCGIGYRQRQHRQHHGGNGADLRCGIELFSGGW